MRQTGDMTVRNPADVIGRFRFKLRDHPELYFVIVFRRGLREELRHNIFTSFTTLKAIEAEAIAKEDKMGRSVVVQDGGEAMAAARAGMRGMVQQRETVRRTS